MMTPATLANLEKLLPLMNFEKHEHGVTVSCEEIDWAYDELDSPMIEALVISWSDFRSECEAHHRQPLGKPIAPNGSRHKRTGTHSGPCCTG